MNKADGEKWWGFWLLALLLVVAPARADSPSFRVEDVQTRLENGVYVLDARLRLRLSRDMRRALESGLPLVFKVRIEVIRPRRFLWDETLATITQRYELQLHPLSGQYVLRHLNTGIQQTFRSLDAALAQLGDLRDIPVIDAKLLAPDVTYRGRIRVVLDDAALPMPLKVRAYTRSGWRVQAPWTTWSLP